MRIATICLLPLLLCSCIEFREQTTTWRHDRATDTMRIFQEYRGIQASGETLTAQDKEQLRSVMEGERTFFFANWIFEFDKERSRKQVGELARAMASPDWQMTAEERAKLTAAKALLEVLIDNVKVENGPFYRDAEGRLCGYQEVTVTRVQDVVKAANAVITAAVLAAREEPKLAAARLAAEKGFAWVTIDGNQLVFRMPMELAIWQDLKRQRLASGLALLVKPDATAAELRQSFLPLATWLATEFQYGYRDGAMACEFGTPTGDVSTLDVALKADGKDNLTAYVADTYGVAQGVDPGAGRQAFLGVNAAGE